MLGLSTSPSLEMYELAVIGGGPAGLAAAVYGASEGLKTVLIESTTTGGQAGRSSQDRELPRLPHRRLGRRADHVGPPAGRAVRRRGHHHPQGGRARGQRPAPRTIEFEDGSTIGAQAVILATGVDYRQLQVTGCWDDPDDPACNYIGRGVYYGASVSDASECEGEDVYIVGGANSAGQAAMFMSQTAKSVTLLVRGPSLEASMSYYLIQQIEKNANITVRTCTEVVDTLGEDDHLTGLVLLDKQTGETRDGGLRPAVLLHRRRRRAPTGWTAWSPATTTASSCPARTCKDVCGWTLDRPPHHLETSVPGVFVAGDVRAESAKRVAAAVGEGSMAVMLVHRYLAEA